MRRADRLFRIVERLKASRRAVSAGHLAEELSVSVRTVYRDMADLSLSGVPVLGEAGVGYVLDRNFIVRPMMFDAEELDALMLGARMVESWGDKDLARGARRAMDRIAAALPDSLRADLQQTALFSPPAHRREPITADVSQVRAAIRQQRPITMEYCDLKERTTYRTIRPLCISFFGPVWLLGAWCEIRDDFRNFRLDRIRSLEVHDTPFPNDPDKSLRAYLDAVGCAD